MQIPHTLRSRSLTLRGPAATILALGVTALLAAPSPAQVPMYILQGGPSIKDFATAVAGAGDVNGDGFGDILVGIPNTSHPTAPGAAQVFSGRDGTVLFTLGLNIAGDQFGKSVAGLGDINADGFADFIIGQANGATVYSGADASVLYQINGSPTSGFGNSVAGLGDVDGDGVRDFIVGAPGLNSTTGAAVVYSGATGLIIRSIQGAGPGSYFGRAVSDVGDVNNDGHDDFAVGFNDGAQFIGLAGVYSGADGTQLRQWGGTAANDNFGGAVGAAGDVDGDGYPDVIVGATQAGVGAGYAKVFSVRTGAVLQTFNGTVALGSFGRRVGGVGDADHDGHDDVFVSEPDTLAAGPQPGHVYLYSGATGAVIRNFTGKPGWQLGESAAAAGDVNGDGRVDLVAGSPSEAILGATGLDGVALVQVLSLPWLWQGGGLAGTRPAPILSAFGTLVGGSPGSVDLAGALPSSQAAMVLGLNAIGKKFKGGVMVPAPDFVALGLPTDSVGSITLPFTWPTGVPTGTTIWLQMWVTDAGGPQGFSASNGLSATSP